MWETTTNMDPTTELELLRRGLAAELPGDGLAQRLSSGDRLRVKLGVDPTASRVHLGWAVVLRKLRQFQEMGHTAVLIIGDYTAQIGDPSGKSTTRRQLSSDQVKIYAQACLERLMSVLLAENLEVRYNSEWLAPMRMEDVLALASNSTVAQMLERDDFAKRFAAKTPISIIEFLYPLLQAYDSVSVNADVELGGTDQTFNNLMGRHLQSARGQRPQLVCTVPLLVGTDGKDKMSQSLGNFIAIDDAPDDMFGKLMSIPDDVIVNYARLCSWWPTAKVEELRAGLENGALHPNTEKRRMAHDVVDIYHGPGSGADAETAFDRQFKFRQLPHEVPDYVMSANHMTVAHLVADAFDLSKSEARRLVEQGGVKLDQVSLGDAAAELKRPDIAGMILQAGKRRFVRLVSVP